MDRACDGCKEQMHDLVELNSLMLCPVCYEIELDRLKQSEHKTNCDECGRFVSKDRWVRNDVNMWPLCPDCFSDYG